MVSCSQQVLMGYSLDYFEHTLTQLPTGTRINKKNMTYDSQCTGIMTVLSEVNVGRQTNLDLVVNGEL